MKLSLDQLISNLLNGLDSRSKNIMKRRFNLTQNGSSETLASLGKELNVTRERIRQIEAQSLSKVNGLINDGAGREFFDAIKERLNYFGGVRRMHDLAQDLAFQCAKGGTSSQLFVNQVRFLVEAAGSPAYAQENSNFHAMWYVNRESLEKSRAFCKALKEILEKKKSEVLEQGGWHGMFAGTLKTHKLSEYIGLNFLATSKNFAVNPYGDFGLSHWPYIKPKTMRDKAYLVLRKENKPLHFEHIAERINMMSFDRKTAHPPTVHNELIRDKRFVLVGRGIYALKEQGYFPGTARETLVRLLSNKGPMDRNSIMDLVLSERFLKPNTIFLNLQNRKYFKRLNDGRYTLA